MQHRQNVAQKPNGDIVAGASVTVTTYPAGVAAVLYSDNGITPIPGGNVVSTDLYGNYSYYVANGRYTETIVGTGLTTQTLQDIVLADPAAPTITGGSINGTPIGATTPSTAVFTAIKSPIVDPLKRWRDMLRTDAANAKVVLIGDSTSDDTTSAATIVQQLRAFHTLQGQKLYGMTGDSSHIIAQGVNGVTLAVWNATSSYLTTLVASAPNLVIASFGLNDVRLGLCTQAQLKSRLQTMITNITAALPNADILLRIPNTMLTTNVSGFNYVQDSGGGINPAGAAQSYSTIIRNAYLELQGIYNNVDVIDIPDLVFGTVARSTHPLMADQLHPTIASSTVGSTKYNGGYVAIAGAIANQIGIGGKGFALDKNQYTTIKEYICNNGGSGFIDFGAVDATSEPASNWPLSTSDVMFVDNFSSPISLASATIFRPFNSVNIRVLVTGDYTSCVGHRVFIGSSQYPVVGSSVYRTDTQLPYVLAQTAIPVILAPNGTVATNGTITLGTALPTIYANAWIRLPAGAVSGGSAGVYFCQFSSTTVGQVYTNFADPSTTAFTPSIPTSPVAATGSNAAYTQTTASTINLVNVNVPANSMGSNGALRASDLWSYPNNANNKTPSVSFGGTAFFVGAQTTTNTLDSIKSIRNRGSASSQVTHASTVLGSPSGVAITQATINTAADQTLALQANIATATDYIVLEGFTIEVLHKP